MPDPARLRLLTCSEAEADLFLYRRGREPGTVTRVIRGRRCAVLDRCMAEWGAAMQLPYCFENTWESLAQCLGELTSFEGKTLVLMITNANRVLPRAKDDFVKMFGTLGAFQAQGPAGGRTARLELIVHSDPRDADALRARLAATNVSCVAVQEPQQ